MIKDLNSFKNFFKQIRPIILEIYNNEIEVEYKKDLSPLTLADKKVNEAICNFLEDYGLPIMSEEGKHISFDERCLWTEYWLVDPIDGTKSFISKTGDFTVNIALIKNGSPSYGFVYIPVDDILYYGGKNFGSFKIENLTKEENIVSLPCLKQEILTFVASKDHLDEDTKTYISSFEENKKFVSIGSSIKFCYVAEGLADIYPRFSPTMEWDTGAGQAVAEGAGKNVNDFLTNESLKYNRADLRNGWFIVS